ncbi:hypothetical protein XELAEV_18026939mg [Xenopus laevis]|uniref:Uncharacterized protein n=1 Tax=Xenopus laevis TaxID=8355 RepID=A0A974CUN8_XENLA|nr:hypothetical protein XELAEV_18026939mg [Xenopus laevis]
MKSTYGGGTVKPLKDWHKWSSGLEWSIPKEGTFEVWIWEKFVREFHSRLQTHGSLEKANLWSNIIMYFRPAKTAESNNDKDETEVQTGLNLLATQVTSTASAHLSPSPSPHPESAKDVSDKTDYCRLGKSDLVTLCEARGISIIDKSKLECIEALERDDFQQGPEGDYRRYGGGKEFCKQLTDKMPTMYSVVSPFQFMTAIQGPDEDASVCWQRLKQGVTDAGFEPGPDASENTQPVSPIHLMLRLNFWLDWCLS